MFDSQMFAANPKDRQIGFDKTFERYMQNGLKSHPFPYNVCDGARNIGAHIRLPSDCACSAARIQVSTWAQVFDKFHFQLHHLNYEI